jgi:hypothetical protein
MDKALFFTHPKLCEEWDYNKNIDIDIKVITYGSGKKASWVCHRGHEWNADINSRTVGGNGCPYCCNQKINNENCLATKFPDLLKIWNFNKNIITPYSVSPMSGKKAWWICEHGHEWEAVIGTISNGCGCPYCSGQRVYSGNCLFNENPELASEWNFEKNSVSPNDVGVYSPKKYWWKCKNGHEWEASVNNRNRHNRGCSKCKKYILEDGIVCDSLIEAFYYLKYKEENLNFMHGGKYPGKRRFLYDFYFPECNKYVEVTSFTKKSRHGESYYKRIREKEMLVYEINAKFEFICKNLTKEELTWIKAKVTGRTFSKKFLIIYNIVLKQSLFHMKIMFNLSLTMIKSYHH